MTQLNTRTLALERAVASAVSESGLPPCVAGLVLDKLRGEVAALEARALAQEAERAKEEPPEGVAE